MLSAESNEEHMTESQAERECDKLSDSGSEDGAATAPATNATLERAKDANQKTGPLTKLQSITGLGPPLPSDAQGAFGTASAGAAMPGVSVGPTAADAASKADADGDTGAGAGAAAALKVIGAALEAPTSVQRQDTPATQTAGLIAALGIAAPTADTGLAIPAGGPAAADAPALGAEGLGGVDDTSEDEDDEDELTAEDKEKAEHVNKVEAVIADAEGAGFTFSVKTKWLAAEAYVNNEKLFDDAEFDITDCVKEGKSVINGSRVNEKIAELRAAAAAAAALTPYQGGLSQENIGEEEEEEEEEDAAESDDEFDGLSKQSLEQKKDTMTVELAVAQKKLEVDPVRLAIRACNKDLVAAKPDLKSSEYDVRKDELKFMIDHYNKQYFNKTEHFSLFQLKFMSAMFLAEIEKRVLPSHIGSLQKDLKKIKSALELIKLGQMEKQDAKKSDKTKKRAAAAIANAIGSTPPARRRRTQ